MNLTTTMPSQKKLNSWITIGSFDGVHIGHQALIKELVAQAQKSNSQSVVVTFWPLPATVFKRAPLAWALTSPEERKALLLSLGVDQVVTLDFNQSLADLTAERFLQRLDDNFNIAGLLVGPNFALGKNRLGTVEKLAEIGREMFFELKVLEPFATNQGMVSSSRIRADLGNHDVRAAAEKLGRPYRLTGKVVHGEHRGTGLGVPTANLEAMPERMIPANGVYVTRALVNNKAYASVTNIGVRPTFENPLPTPRVEPHILDMQDQLYQQELSLEFFEYLRPEIKFANAQELVAQIQKDIARTREICPIDCVNG